MSETAEATRRRHVQRMRAATPRPRRGDLCALATMIVLLLACLGSPAAAIAEPLGAVEPKAGGQGVQWQPLPNTPEWGYKIAVSQQPRNCEPGNDPPCRKAKDEFVIQRNASATQEFIVWPTNLHFTPVNNEVWVGVGTMKDLKDSHPVWSATEALVRVQPSGNSESRLEAPRELFSEGGTAFWNAIGAWGYKVVLSNAPRCLPQKTCRVSQEIELPASPTGSYQPYAPCLQELGQELRSSLTANTVYLGVGSMRAIGENPPSYTGGEISLIVPGCPPPVVQTGSASGRTQFTATVTGQVNPQGRLISSCVFQYGATAAYGNSVPCKTPPGPVAGAVPVEAVLPALAPGSTYHYQLVTVGIGGAAAGGDQEVTTLALPPANIAPPVISGRTLVGFSLKSRDGSWTNSPQITRQWQLCDAAGANCQDVPGAVGESFGLTNSDVGDTLRVVVTAQNSGGSGDAASPTTAVVGSRVEARVGWSVEWFNRYAVVTGVTIAGVPSGASVELLCAGRGCPFSERRVGAEPATHHVRCHRHRHCRRVTSGVAQLFAGHRLRAGTVVTARIVKPAWEGRIFQFVVRSHRRPEYREACLQPGATTPSACE